MRHQNYKNKTTETKYLDNTQKKKVKNSLSQLKKRELGDREIKTRNE